jgi:hypothetical protein
MTKKDFQLIANVLYQFNPESGKRRLLYESLLSDFVVALSSTSNSFNETKFLEACGFFEVYPQQKK